MNAHRSSVSIVLVEDNPADVFLIGEALREHGLDTPQTVLETGDRAIHLIDRLDASPRSEYPDLILLDLNLPRRTGEEVLGHLRSRPNCASIPVIVMTSSDAPRDRDVTAELGVAAYFQKPVDLVEFMKLGRVVANVLSEHPRLSASSSPGF